MKEGVSYNLRNLTTVWPWTVRSGAQMKWTRRISTWLQGRHTIITQSRKGCSYRQSWVSWEGESSLPINTIRQREEACRGRMRTCEGDKMLSCPRNGLSQWQFYPRFREIHNRNLWESLAWKEFRKKSCNKISFKLKKKNFRDYLIQFSQFINHMLYCQST